MPDLTQLKALALKVANNLEVMDQNELAELLRGCQNIRNYGVALNLVQQFRDSIKGKLTKPIFQPQIEEEKAANKEHQRQWCAAKQLKINLGNAWDVFRRIKTKEEDERHEAGFLSYRELRRIGSENGWVRWSSSGLMERLSIGEDGRLYAESGITKRHNLPGRVRWYRCSLVAEGGDARVSIVELMAQRTFLIDHGFNRFIRDNLPF